MDFVKEEHQARKAEERVQWDQQPAASVLNRGRERRRTKYYLTFIHVPQNLDDAILDLHQRQLAQQHQLLDHLQITRVEAERQRQVEERQLQQQSVVEQLEVVQAARRVEPAPIVQINQIMEEWRNEDVDALDYEGQQNRNDNGDLHVDRNMQENILRVVSNIFHSLLVDEYWSSLIGCWRKQCSRVRCTRWCDSGMIIFEYQNSTLLTIELDPRCYYSRWYSTTCSSAYTLSTSWTTILRGQCSLSQLGHAICHLSSLSCSSLWLWKAYFFMG